MFALIRFPLMLAIYILAAILPSILLMRYIYRQDRVEKEPMSLLMSLMFFGVVAAVLAGFWEPVADRLLGLFFSRTGHLYTVLFAFLVVAATEESAKLLFLKWRTWGDRNFDCRFDGIVYAVFVSLGFAAYENLLYVFRYGLSVALPRAVLSVPGHLAFAVVMGLFYGRARLAQARGRERSVRRYLRWAWLLAVALHGFYDACAMIGTPVAITLFSAFVLILYYAIYRLIRRESAQDRPF